MSTFEGKKDFTADLQATIPESVTIAKEKGIDDAITLLLALEKKCRLNNDSTNLKEVCLHMLRLCREKADWMKLNSTIAIINKRNSLHKLTITSVVAECLTYLDSTPDIETRIELLKALKSLCDGKIYVEGESAKLHFMLAKIYEERNDVSAACETIQDVHVETYGSLSKKEKAEYILEQMRLNLLKKDYIRTLIHSRKMNTKTIEENGFEAIKVQFYTMMIEYYTTEKNPWEICQAYYKIAVTGVSDGSSVNNLSGDSEAEAAMDGDGTQSSASTTVLSLNERQAALESCIIFLLMSKFDNHQSDMMHRVKQQLDTLFRPYVSLSAAYVSVLGMFTTHEVIPRPFPVQQHQEEIEQHPCLRKVSYLGSATADHFVGVFRDRIVQHNLRVVARYYKRIRMARLGELLSLSLESLESYLSEMSSTGDIALKVDRPAGIVSFQLKKQPEEILSAWSSDVDKMLQLMEATCHLINRENMVYKL